MTLNVEDVKRVTREILAEYGDNYTYQADPEALGCEYRPQPGYNDGCLIGQIVKRLDPHSYERLVATDEQNSLAIQDHPWFAGEYMGASLNQSQRDHQVGTGIIKAPNGLALAMRRAQQSQDAGHKWSHAAEEILNYEEVPA